MKFVKWFVRKIRSLTMVRQVDEFNDFIEEVTDGSVKQMKVWGDERIKKVVQVLVAEGIKISIVDDMVFRRRHLSC